MTPLTLDHTKLLRMTAGLIVEELRGRADCASIANHFKDCDKHGIDRGKDDRGLCICELLEPVVRLRVWLGQYGLDGELRFWAGLSGRGANMLDFIANVPSSYAPINTFSKENYGERFAKTLKGGDFGKVFQQPFGSDWYWLGFYHPTPISDQADYSDFISMAVEMFTDIARHNMAFSRQTWKQSASSPMQVYNKAESRLSFRKRLDRERTHQLARGGATIF